MRVIFIGTSPLAASVLSFLIKACVEVTAVFTVLSKLTLDNDYLYTDVERIAYLCKVPVFEDSFLTSFFCARLCSNMNVDYIIVVSSGMVLESVLLNIPRFGCFNIHLAVLPRFSGAAPLYYTFIAVDCFVGITIIRMSEKVDGGPIVTIKYCNSFYYDTLYILCLRLCFMVVYILLKYLILFFYSAVMFIGQNTCVKMQTKKVNVMCLYSRDLCKRVMF